MAESLAEIYEEYRADPAFAHLRTRGIVLVPGEGAPRPKVLIVGEAPGAMENLKKRPFVGASGIVLRSLIDEVAMLQEDEYFITNMVKYRPPGNRTPWPAEIAASLPYLRREYRALGGPAVLVAVGGTAYEAFRPEGVTASITKVAGSLIGYANGRWLLPMLHPAYGLRNAAVRPKMESDWESFGDWFKKEVRYAYG